MSVNFAWQHGPVVGGMTRALFLATLLFATTAYAQSTTGTILGTVTDASGGVLPGATVTITNTGTGLTRIIPTSSDGAFLAPALPSGTYQVDVTLEGFKSFSQDGIRLEVGQNARVDAHLELGTISEQISVTSNVLQVDTQSSTVGVVIDKERLENLPMIGRGVLSMALLVPGIATATLPATVTNQRNGPTITVGGTRGNQNNVTLDGAQLAASLFNTAQNLPSPDSLEEFQVLTNTYSAEYGRASGATMMAITKSGTNNVRGRLWEYFRNDALNAKNFFAPSKPYLRQNQFGGSIGGPIVRNRTFFFGSYEGIRIREQQTIRFFSPTAAQRGGDFSSTTSPIVDPDTGQPFPGNRIPTNRLSPFALNILEDYIPLPNAGAEVNKLATRPTDGNQFTVKVDHRFRNADTFGLRFYRSKTEALSTGNIEALWAPRRNLIQGTTLSNTHVFRNNLLSEARVSYTKILSDGPAASTNKTPRELGARYDQDGSASIAPNATISGGFNMSQLSPWFEQSRLFDFDYKVSWITTGHAVKFGVTGLWQAQDIRTQFNSSGSLNFTGQVTGNPLADFMIGRPLTFTQMTALDGGQLSRTWGAFVQDDVKLGRRVTVNLGLRYDLYEPWEELGGRSVLLRPGQQSTRYPNAPPGLVFPGDAGVPGGLVPADKNNFAPRVGFVWDVQGNGRTSVRGAYGLFHTVDGAITTAHGNEAPPFVQVVAFTPPNADDPYAGRTSPFPSVESASGEALFFYPMQIFSINPDFGVGQIHQFNVNVQQQLGQDLIVQLGYIGNRGRHLASKRETNAAVFGPGATAANIQQRRPYFPEYFAGIAEAISDGSSNYNSFQIGATKRYSRGYTIQVAYTLSKSMDDNSGDLTGPQNPADPHDGEWALSNFDRRHVLRVNGLWELPQLQNRRIIRYVLGGWKVAGIVSKLSGTPINLTSGADVALLGPSRGLSAQRPNLVGDPNLDSGRSRTEQIQRYFNSAAFARPAPGQFGTAGRNLLIGPGSFTADASLTKRFSWSGPADRGVEFRVEVFNLFNTVNLGDPVLTMTSPAFGQIQTAGEARVVQLAVRVDF